MNEVGTEAKFQAALNEWLGKIKVHGSLVKELPEISLLVVENDSITAQIIPFQEPVIEISRAFLRAIERELEVTAENVTQTCLDGFEFSPTDAVAARESVTEACRDCVISFIVLHEIFHILCGHSGLGGVSKHALNETLLGFDKSNTASVNETEYLEAYHLEVEADCCALQCLVQMPLPFAVLDFFCGLQGEDVEITTMTKISGLHGAAQVLGFRLLLATSWIVVRLFEKSRCDGLKQKSLTHPLPDARMLAAVSTIFEEYCGISKRRRVDAKGQPWHKLTKSTAKKARVFVDCVMKPFAKATLGSNFVTSGVFGPEAMIFEFGNSISKTEYQTEAGREIENLNRVRKTMQDRLSKLRFYEGIQDRYE